MKSKIQYILTWVALSLMLISSAMLMASVWNAKVLHRFSPLLTILLWFFICASGIYLFMLAVKKAHRQWIDEERQQEHEAIREKEKRALRRGPTKEKKELDFNASARKLVRRIPEKISLEQMGSLLLKNLARELEIMSGVYFIEKKGRFMPVSTYAIISAEPQAFKEGEGLNGQVARNQQILLLTKLPEGHLEVYSGLGKAAPSYLAIVPLVHKGRTVALFECSGYRYEPGEIESMLRIFARDLMDKLSLNLA
jgi:GAF domain